MEDGCVFWPLAPPPQQRRASVASGHLAKKLLLIQSASYWAQSFVLRCDWGASQKCLSSPRCLRDDDSTLCWFYRCCETSRGAPDSIYQFHFLWQPLMSKCFGFWQHTRWITTNIDTFFVMINSFVFAGCRIARRQFAEFHPRQSYYLLRKQINAFAKYAVCSEEAKVWYNIRKQPR